MDRREYLKAYRKRNKARLQEYHRQYAERYYLEHSDQQKDYSRKYRKEHLKEILEKQKHWQVFGTYRRFGGDDGTF